MRDAGSVSVRNRSGGSPFQFASQLSNKSPYLLHAILIKSFRTKSCQLTQDTSLLIPTVRDRFSFFYPVSRHNYGVLTDQESFGTRTIHFLSYLALWTAGNLAWS